MVSQWETAQEALDQLTDELGANRNLLMDSQQKADRLKGQTGTLWEQVGPLKQQGGARSQTHMKGLHLAFTFIIFSPHFGISHRNAWLAPSCVRAYMISVFLCNINVDACAFPWFMSLNLFLFPSVLYLLRQATNESSLLRRNLIWMNLSTAAKVRQAECHFNPINFNLLVIKELGC